LVFFTGLGVYPELVEVVQSRARHYTCILVKIGYLINTILENTKWFRDLRDKKEKSLKIGGE
jgi:hypothetical protein